VRIQLRNRPHCDADAVLSAEGSIRYAVMRGVAGIAGVASPRHAYQGISREPRRARYFSRLWARLRPTQRNQVPGKRGLPAGSEQALDEEKPVAKGDRRRQLRVDEQSYDSIVPMKVENRRAPEKGRPRHPLEGSRSDASCSSCGCKSRRWRVPRCHRSYTRQREG
jgi:hypothetical protein